MKRTGILVCLALTLCCAGPLLADTPAVPGNLNVWITDLEYDPNAGPYQQIATMEFEWDKSETGKVKEYRLYARPIRQDNSTMELVESVKGTDITVKSTLLMEQFGDGDGLWVFEVRAFGADGESEGSNRVTAGCGGRTLPHDYDDGDGEDGEDEDGSGDDDGDDDDDRGRGDNRDDSGGDASEARDQGDNTTQDDVTSVSLDLRGGSEAVLFPNPAQTQTTLRFHADAGEVQVSILTMRGTLVLQTTHFAVQGQNALALPLSELAPGMHLIRISQQDSSVSLPLQILR